MSDADRIAAARANAAAPGTLAALHGALKARVQAIASAYWGLATKTEGVTRAPIVVDGWLPPKDVDSDRFPFLILRQKSGQDSAPGADESSTAAIEIVVGTYSDTDDGWLDVLLLVDAIRLDLAAEPVIADTAFFHVGPLGWQIPEQQPRPQWFGVITTNWNIPRPQRVDSRNP